MELPLRPRSVRQEPPENFSSSLLPESGEHAGERDCRGQARAL